MTKSERILNFIPKLNELDESNLNTVIKVADACSIMQLLHKVDTQNLKKMVEN
jgi:hypothetical protein